MGNLTRDPEVKTIPSGQLVATFGVATNRRWTSSAGEQQEETEFHDVVAWGKLAEICEQILYKGRKLLVEGRLKTRSWEGQDGVKRYKTEIVAENIAAAGPGRDSGNYTPQSSGTTSKPADSTSHADEPTQKSAEDEKDADKTEKEEKPVSDDKKTDEKPEKKDKTEKDLDDILNDMPF